MSENCAASAAPILDYGARIVEYMSRHRIPTYAAFARLVGEISPQTVSDTVRGRYTPRQRRVVAALEKTLSQQSPASASSRKLEVAANQLMAVNFLLHWLIFNASTDDRHRLREILGQEMQDFLDLTRALTNEQMRAKVLEEDGERLQKGGDNGRNS